MNFEALKKRIHLAKLDRKLAAAVKRRGSLTHPEVLGISRLMDRLVVDIMRLEGVA